MKIVSRLIFILISIFLASCSNDSKTTNTSSVCLSVPNKYSGGNSFFKTLLKGISDSTNEGVAVIVPKEDLYARYSGQRDVIDSFTQFLNFTVSIQDPKLTAKNREVIIRTIHTPAIKAHEENTGDIPFSDAFGLWIMPHYPTEKFFLAMTTYSGEMPHSDNLKDLNYIASCSFRGQPPFDINKSQFSCTASLDQNDVLIQIRLNEQEFQYRQEIDKMALDLAKSWRVSC